MSATPTAARPTLAEQITVEPTRARVVDDCVRLVDDEVKGTGGLGGIAVRAAYATINTIKKGFVREVVDALLDDWVRQLESHYGRWRAAGGTTSFADHVTARSDDVADDLLKVTDERAERTRHNTARKAYQKLRGSAKKHVAGAVPKLGRLVERHFSA
jgi:hypothetical protein